MNGESVFGWLKVAAVIAAIFFLWFLWDKIKGFFAHPDLPAFIQNNPLKRAIDAPISAVTGRDETLGGWLNEMLDPNAKKVAALSKPIGMSTPNASNEPFIGDIPVDAAAGSSLPAWFARGFFGVK